LISRNCLRCGRLRFGLPWRMMARSRAFARHGKTTLVGTDPTRGGQMTHVWFDGF
jgi:hypothetical protein